MTATGRGKEILHDSWNLMWGLEGQAGTEWAARWEKHFRQHERYEQSDARKKGNCGVFRGTEAGYYLNVVNIKWTDDKLERHLKEDKPDHERFWMSG